MPACAIRIRKAMADKEATAGHRRRWVGSLGHHCSTFPSHRAIDMRLSNFRPVLAKDM